MLLCRISADNYGEGGGNESYIIEIHSCKNRIYNLVTDGLRSKVLSPMDGPSTEEILEKRV